MNRKIEVNNGTISSANEQMLTCIPKGYKSIKNVAMGKN